MRIEGKLRVCIVRIYATSFPLLTLAQGFDEFMNLVIDEAVEVSLAQKGAPESRRKLGEWYYIALKT